MTPSPVALYRPQVYVASKIRHYQLWRDMRSGRLHFCDIISSWIDSPEVESGGSKAPRGYFPRAWTRNVNEAARADYVLVYCPDGDEALLRGTLIEAGACLGHRGAVIFVGETDASWVSHPQVVHVRWLDDAIIILQYFAEKRSSLRPKPLAPTKPLRRKIS